MGYDPSKDFSICNALSLFACPKKGLKREFESQPVPWQKRALCPMLPRARPARPWLGKEALFYWLVLRTAPYKLIINTLKPHNPIVHVILIKLASPI